MRLELEIPFPGTSARLGTVGSSAGDLCLTPRTMLRYGRAAIAPAEAAIAAAYGWSIIENMPCGRVLIERDEAAAADALRRCRDVAPLP